MVNLVEKIMRAGQPLNAEQLRVLLRGCDVFVSSAEARLLFSRYIQVIHQPAGQRVASRT